MKVAVFGDSFAAPKHDSKTDAGLKSWVDYLSEKHDVTNYAIEGSSLYYSVRQFMTFNYPYDKIIFVTTAPGRLYLSDNPILEEHGHTHLSSLSYAEFVYNEMCGARRIVKDDLKHLNNIAKKHKVLPDEQ